MNMEPLNQAFDSYLTGMGFLRTAQMKPQLYGAEKKPYDVYKGVRFGVSVQKSGKWVKYYNTGRMSMAGSGVGLKSL